jgi:hypothetical protein
MAIHVMLQGGPADGQMYSLRRHQPPPEIRIGVWVDEAWVATGTAHVYILIGEEAMENTSGLHTAASYQYGGERDSSEALITFWM